MNVAGRSAFSVERAGVRAWWMNRAVVAGVIVAAWLWADARWAVAEVVVPVADINTVENTAVGLTPGQIVVFNELFYFSGRDGRLGRELWRSDGTANGTYLLKDINPFGDSDPRRLTVSGGWLYFVADDGEHGPELWRSDGTTAGTVLVRDIVAGGAGADPQFLVDVAGTLFFTADDPALELGVQLWKSDGTSEGTAVVGNVNPTGQQPPINLAAAGELLVFAANNNDVEAGYELWRSDGTHDETQGWVDINPFGSSTPEGFVVVNNRLFFAANGGGSIGVELWSMDGASETASLSLEADINPFGDSNPRHLTQVGIQMYFVADDGVAGPELWRYDSTRELIQVRVFGNSTDDEVFGITDINEVAYFFFYDSVEAVVEVWTSLGGASNTVKIADLGPIDDLVLDIDVTESTPLEDVFDAIARRYSPVFIPNRVYLPGLDINGDFEILTTRGTAQTTERAFNVNGNGSAYPAYFNVVDLVADLVFSADTFGQGEELMLYDPGGDIARRLSDVRRPGDASPALLLEIDGTLHFAASDGIRGVELWRVDDAADDVTAVVDLSPNDLNGDRPVALEELDGTVVFVIQNRHDMYELWSATGPHSIKLADVSRLGVPIDVQLAKVGDQIFFTAEDGENGFELWRTDGTLSGTRLVKDIHLGGDAFPRHFADVTGILFFSADDGENGVELWRSDGTLGGTVMVADINPNGSSQPEHLTVLGDKVYFSANDGVNGVELWRGGLDEDDVTAMVSNVNPSGDANPRLLTVVDGRLYFAANDGTHGLELWQSNGTDAGTALVRDINSGGAGAVFSEMTAVGDRLYFAADDGASGEELWTSDGTAAGTVQVVDLVAGGGAKPRQLTAFDGRIYFAATDSVYGEELWRSDGTAQGTELVKDINAVASAHPVHLKAQGDKLYFAADDGETGMELWTVDLNGTDNGPDADDNNDNGSVERSSDSGGGALGHPLLVLLAGAVLLRRRGRTRHGAL